MMLTLITDEITTWDPRLEQFIQLEGSVTYNLMHSLQAISKWESKYKIPFMTTELSEEQTQYYVQCMEIDGIHIDFVRLTPQHFDQIIAHIMDNQTATTIKMDSDGQDMVITSEILYALMSIHGIPYECDKWHFSRLNTLIQTVSFFKKDKKKMTKEQIQMSNAELNAQRRKELNSKG